MHAMIRENLSSARLLIQNQSHPRAPLQPIGRDRQSCLASPTSQAAGSLKLIFVCIVLTFASLGVLATTPVFAGPPRIVSIEIGVDNIAKAGHWTVARILIQTDEEPFGGHLDLRVPDGDGLVADWQLEDKVGQEAVIELQPGERRVVERYIRIGRTRGQLEARLRKGEQIVARLPVTFGERFRLLESTRPWHVLLGGQLPLERVWEKMPRTTALPPVVSMLNDPTHLPRFCQGYDGIDTLWFLTGNATFLEGWSPAQWRALVEWVKSGGRLVLSLGRNAHPFAGTNAPLRQLLPAEPGPLVQVREVPGLESFAHAQDPLGPLVAVSMDPSGARVLAWLDAPHAGRRPAICRYALGLGVVTWVMFDLDQSAVQHWSATPALLSEIARVEAADSPPAGREELTRRVVHLGFEEITGQLRSALDVFPGSPSAKGVAMVSFTAVAGLLVLYIVWLGPGEFGLAWLFRYPRHWSWATWLVGIVSFCALIFALHRLWRSTTSPLVNLVELVDIDVDTSRLRGTLWGSVYSGGLAKYSWQIQPVLPMDGVSLDLHHQVVSWQGLPGTGLGGLDRTAIEMLSGIPYRIRTQEHLHNTRLVDAPILASGTRGIWGQWWGELSQPVASNLWADRNGFLKGSFPNPLGIPLQDTLIAYGRWAYRAEGTWEPGAVLRIDQLQRRDLEWLLTRRRIVSAQTSYASTPWDRQSRDVDRIMEIMLFHTAAGGRTYTGLGHQYQGYIDLSEHLQLNRAIVVGRVQVPVSGLNCQPMGHPTIGRRWTYYRFVVPVRRIDSIGEKVTPQ